MHKYKYNTLERALLGAGVAPRHGSTGSLYCLAIFPVALTEKDRSSDRRDPKSLWNRRVGEQKDRVIRVLHNASIQNVHAKSELGRAEFSRFLKIELRNGESPREGRVHLLETLNSLGIAPISLRTVNISDTPWGEQE